MRRLVVGLLFAGILSGCEGSCASEGDLAEATTVDAPEGLLVEALITGTDALLRGLSEQSRSDAVRQILPRTAAELAERIARIPPAAMERVAPGASILAVLVERRGEPRSVVAIELAPGAELGPAVPLVDGGPHGSQFLFRRPRPEEPGQVKSGDAIVWAERTDDLEALLPYAISALRREGPPAVRIRVPEGVMGGPLRRRLDARVEAFVSESRASLTAERARHAEPPALGDPEVALDRGAAALRGVLAYLPDIGEVTATITTPPMGTDLDATFAVAEGSPLARAVADHPSGPAFGVEALPPSTALAVTSRRARSGSPSLLEWLRLVGRARIDDGAGRALDAAESELVEPAGAPSIVAMGGNARGAWMAYGRRSEEGLRDPELLRRVLAVPYVASVIGEAVGCGGPADPAEYVAFGSLDVASVCTRAAPPHPMLQWSREGSALAFGISDQIDPRAAPHPAHRELAQGLSGHTEGLLGADPDAARALEVLGERVLVGAVVAPSRLFASLALLDSPVLRRVAAAVTTSPTPAPTVVGLGADDDGLRLRARISPRGIDHYVELAMLVSRVFGARAMGPAP